MSQGDFGDDNDVDDAFLAELMSTTDDIDVEGENEEDGTRICMTACGLIMRRRRGREIMSRYLS